MRYYGDFDSGMRNESIAERRERLGRNLTKKELDTRLRHKGGDGLSQYDKARMAGQTEAAALASMVHWHRRDRDVS